MENNYKHICDELLSDKGFRLNYLFGAIDSARNDGYGTNKERDDAYDSLIKIANICGAKIEKDQFGVPFVKNPI